MTASGSHTLMQRKLVWQSHGFSRTADGARRLPLLIKGSCPSAHTGAEGIRTPIFLCALIDVVLQSLSQKSKIFASSLYTREPLGAPAPVRLSIFLRRINVLYHIHTTFFLCAMTWGFDSLRASARPGRRSDSYFGFFSMASQLARPVRLTRASISSASRSVS